MKFIKKKNRELIGEELSRYASVADLFFNDENLKTFLFLIDIAHTFTDMFVFLSAFIKTNEILG